IERFTNRDLTPQLTRTGRQNIIPRLVSAENIHDVAEPTWLKESDLATFRAGAFRTDARALLSHVAHRERHFVEQSMSLRELSRVGLKDANGEFVKGLKTQHDVDVATGNPGAYVLIHPEAAVTWYKTEVDILKEVTNAVEHLKSQ